MKNEKNNINLFLTLYSHANDEIELLKKYYDMTHKDVVSHRISIEKKYEPGKTIDSLIESIINKATNTIDEEKLKEVNDKIIIDDIKFSDIINNVSVNTNTKRIQFSFVSNFNLKEQYNPNIARYKYKEAERYEAITSRSIISDIIVSFESLLTKILNSLIFCNPLPYLEGETISLASFFMDNASKNLIEKINKVVEKRMYDSLKTLEQIIQIEKIDVDKEVFASFKEIYFRRNVIIHNDCKVNKQYLDAIHSKFRKNVKLGDLLTCDDNYVRNSFDVVQELFFFIFYGIFNNYSEDNKYISVISNFAFKKLQKKEYLLAKTIYKKISNNSKIEFIDKMMYRINYLNAIKQLNEKEQLEKELKTLDVSIATDDFKIAKLCLLNKNEEIYLYLNKTYPNSFNAISLKEWPIFVNFRESQEYQKFCAEHSEDFLSEEIVEETEQN